MRNARISDLFGFDIADAISWVGFLSHSWVGDGFSMIQTEPDHLSGWEDPCGAIESLADAEDAEAPGVKLCVQHAGEVPGLAGAWAWEGGEKRVYNMF